VSRAGPFDRRVVLALVAVGGAAFLLFLYALGAGWTGGDRAMGSGHAASRALNGYAGLVQLLERRGHQVALSRTPGRLDEEALLVLTPPHFADAEDLGELLDARRRQGPTLLVLPKWFGFEASTAGLRDAPEGWVVLMEEAEAPEWADEVRLGKLDQRIAASQRWTAGADSGPMPLPKQVQTMSAEGWDSLVEGPEGRALAARHRDEADAPVAVIPAAPASAEPVEASAEYWPLFVVADPDLVNNAGLADAERARLAVGLVDAALDGGAMPVVFDLTLPGLGRSENLLTLAFEPPFLAVTLTLLLAALVIGWRGSVRFGPPRAETPALAGGKAQLARDGALLVERARRMRLVGPPYAELLTRRIAGALGLSRRLEPEARAAAIARAMERRGEDPAAFAGAADTLARARKPSEILRAAQALKTIERTLSR